MINDILIDTYKTPKLENVKEIEIKSFLGIPYKVKVSFDTIKTSKKNK